MYWRFMTLREDFMRNFYPHFGVTASVWYWHFVDVVWFCVYFIVYIWGSVVIV
jgi:heme/copper-type cytochrome/quinol oxidase subunit 3